MRARLPEAGVRRCGSPTPASLLVLLMSVSFGSPSFAFSSHFHPDGAPLSELSWSSSLAVVAVSFSGLFTFIFLMLACLCCKKGDVGFKEFDNAEGEDYTTEFSVQGSPAAQNGPEVYILPLTEVSLPMSKQPGRSVQLLKSTDLGRHSLLYLKEIGHGWFGKVLLGEVNSGVSSTQVVVKELKVSASVQDQMQFLEEAQPYRALQHTNLLQCLAQCAEVTPYLLVMEYCPLGDLKGYLRSCRAADSMAPDPLTLQRMACEVACGLLHLHRNNYVHSDLALRNCSLTADLTVKIGDYGLSHCKYKEDYFVTTDQLWVPLRWIAPELIDEVHGNLLVVDQTKSSNIWSLGVTIWELFELGSQPYHLYSDRQVLSYTIKEQQLKLPKPQLKLSLSDRWYEVMQFCWLQSDQRPTAEEIHLLLSYLCAKGATEVEEEFEKRWNSMKPSSSAVTNHQNAEVSSYPLLEQFASDDFHSDGDDILTVTETSHGLNFEYKWEHTKPETLSGALSPSNAQYQDIYYSAISTGKLSLGVSPSCYECKQGCPSLHATGIVPILSAHSPSVSSEYYIRIEEPSECNTGLDYTMCSYSPEYQQESPIKAACWCGKEEKGNLYDSDNSPSVSVTMEPLLVQDPLISNSCQVSDPYKSYISRDKEKYQQCPADNVDDCLPEDSSDTKQEWTVPSFRETFFKDPLGVSPSVHCLCRDSVQLPTSNYKEQEEITFPDRSLEDNTQKAANRSLKESKAKSEGYDSITVEVSDEERGISPEYQHGGCESNMFEEDNTIILRKHWTSNSSSNNNISSCAPQLCEDPDAWYNRRVINFKGLVTEPFGPEPGQNIDLVDVLVENRSSELIDQLAQQEMQRHEDCGFRMNQRDCETVSSTECTLSQEREQASLSAFCHASQSNEKELVRVSNLSQDPCSEFPDPLLASEAFAFSTSLATKEPELMKEGDRYSVLIVDPSEAAPDPKQGRHCTHHSNLIDNVAALPETAVNPATAHKEGFPVSISVSLCHDQTQLENSSEAAANLREISIETNKMIASELDGASEKTSSSISFNETDACSDDDTTELTSGVFMDFSGDFPERVDMAPPFKSLQKQVGTPDSLESLDIPSTTSSCEVFSPSIFNPSSQPKVLDSGYNTENFESPEFVLKEPQDPKDPESSNQMTMSPSRLTITEVSGPTMEMHMSSSFSSELHSLDEKNPYRDSAYFSDYDTDMDKYLKEDEEEEDDDTSEFHDIVVRSPVKTSEPGLRDQNAVTFEQTISKSDSDKISIFSNVSCNTEDSISKTAAFLSCGMPAESFDYVPEEQSTKQLKTQELSFSTKMTLRRETCTNPRMAVKEDSLDDGLGLEANKEAPDSSYFISSAATHTVSSKSISFSSVQLNLEDQGLLSLKQIQSLLPNEKEIAERTELVPDQRSAESSGVTFKMHCPLDVEVSGSQCEPEECVELQGHSTVSKTQVPRLSLDLSLLQRKRGPMQGALDKGDEADEEEDDTEDSDESDEELRCYNIQEQSEESEDEAAVVPVIVSVNSSTRSLRSLLKMPSLLSQSFCEELERKKKVVSFFDDVTVYLFDQESPTKELGDQDFIEPAPQVPTNGPNTASPVDKPSMSDDSSDGNVSEESGGFEWDDDFPLMPVKSSFMSSVTSMVPDPTSQSLPSMDLAQKQILPVQFSRFTVSAASVSRFSITHVSDSDVESVGGSSEDGERE
ncbi:serine/threonine-protein kinase LMTK1 [Rhinatrema bivittatum]|uniref:serine/threonine-protein kinase LMTK1 n=1 Tax=Rhinatrema bivittatum TaxID=194408 RepID=UPI00112990D1|nr:serine/threonine-protein kinase LMTK1 [Rhinatrema bivittatum]